MILVFSLYNYATYSDEKLKSTHTTCILSRINMNSISNVNINKTTHLHIITNFVELYVNRIHYGGQTVFN